MAAIIRCNRCEGVDVRLYWDPKKSDNDVDVYLVKCKECGATVTEGLEHDKVEKGLI